MSVLKSNYYVGWLALQAKRYLTYAHIIVRTLENQRFVNSGRTISSVLSPSKYRSWCRRICAKRKPGWKAKTASKTQELEPGDVHRGSETDRDRWSSGIKRRSKTTWKWQLFAEPHLYLSSHDNCCISLSSMFSFWNEAKIWHVISFGFDTDWEW